jgi:AcrR family transcriptional regulator
MILDAVQAQPPVEEENDLRIAMVEAAVAARHHPAALAGVTEMMVETSSSYAAVLDQLLIEEQAPEGADGATLAFLFESLWMGGLLGAMDLSGYTDREVALKIQVRALDAVVAGPPVDIDLDRIAEPIDLAALAPPSLAEAQGSPRERVLDAAVAVLTSGGPTAFSLAEVSLRSGLPDSTIHRYFGGRTELATAASVKLFDRGLQLKRQLALDTAARSNDLTDAVRAFVALTSETSIDAAEPGEFDLLSAYVAARGNVEASSVFGHTLKSFLGTIQTVTEDLARRGIVRADAVDDLVELTARLVVGKAFFDAVSGRSVSVTRYSHLIATIFSRAYAPR